MSHHETSAASPSPLKRPRRVWEGRRRSYVESGGDGESRPAIAGLRRQRLSPHVGADVMMLTVLGWVGLILAGLAWGVFAFLLSVLLTVTAEGPNLRSLGVSGVLLIGLTYVAAPALFVVWARKLAPTGRILMWLAPLWAFMLAALVFSLMNVVDWGW